MPSAMAYIALQHHNRFIVPVMNRLEEKGWDIKYLVGQAERSQEIAAIEDSLDYKHMFDYLTYPDDIARIKSEYRNLKDSFRRGFLSDWVVGFLPLTTADKTLYNTAQEYVAIDKCLSVEKPGVCFALHEINRWGKMLGFLCRKHKIPFVTLHEGMCYGWDYNYAGCSQYSTLVLTWGERARQKLVEIEGAPPKFVAAGNTHIANEIHRQKNENIRETMREKYGDHYFVLLLLSGPVPDREGFEPLFEEIPGVKLVVKFHPSHPAGQIAKFRRDDAAVYLQIEENTYDLISLSDVCVMPQTSTTMIEALALGRPVVELDVGTAKGFTLDLDGAAVRMDIREFVAELKGGRNFAGDPDAIKNFLAREMKDAENAVENVCNVFEDVNQIFRGGQ